MNAFKRRRYHSVRSFLKDLGAILGHAVAVRDVMHAGRVSPSFRERLMLTVTSVNDCRYCANFHRAQALLVGVGAAEVASLLDGTFEGVPDEEMLAFAYARYWAERDGLPEGEVRQQLVDGYGVHKASTIELLLRLIRTGNLLGNTWDYFLYRISNGKWGLTQREKAAERHPV